MKIVLKAFQNKLSGVMEVPEETGTRFKLAMTQPIQYKHTIFDSGGEPIMKAPILTICEFEWTGGIYSQEGHEYDGAREYTLISIDKIN